VNPRVLKFCLVSKYCNDDDDGLLRPKHIADLK